jgi:hypothetical protein
VCVRGDEFAADGRSLLRIPDGTITVEVPRQQADGTWLWVIDQPSING